MIVYLVRNLSDDVFLAPYAEKELVFLDKKKAIAQYRKWIGSPGFGQADFENVFGIADKVGIRSMSKSDVGADIIALEVTE